MDSYIEQLIRSQLESVTYRLGLADMNVENLSKQLETAKDERDALADEVESLSAALPAETEEVSE